ncbi:MAG: TMEM175 family protein [Vicinamibacterales bacterium]
MAHRHREVSRIEGFSDAVFAFAITLLVVSLEVPKTYHELMLVIRGFPAFAVCFALLFQVWWRHYRFFRSYDLEDGHVVVLTGLLLFVVLFFVYPLKFMWSLPFAGMQGTRVTDDVITQAQVPVLFEIYGAGVMATFAILAAMYLHAYRRRTDLELTPPEVLDATVQIYRNFGIVVIGALSMAWAALAARFAPGQVGGAGLIYFGIGIVEWTLNEYHGRMRRRLEPTSTTDISPA